jgi:hypothetical protein
MINSTNKITKKFAKTQTNLVNKLQWRKAKATPAITKGKGRVKVKL